jgi:uncharacterized membrane protein YqhA
LTSQFINITQYVVILATLSVVLIAVTIFILTSIHSCFVIARTWTALDHATVVKPEFFLTALEIINGMLKGVIFYIIGIGYFSLFIRPLPLCSRIGVTSLHDLEKKLVSVIILIMSVKFLEHFTHWHNPTKNFLLGVAMAIVIAALVAFQRLVLVGDKKENQ